MDRRYTFLLIHGAWHYGELWAPVAENLRMAGHEVHTPTVAGHTRDARPGERDIGHAQGVNSIVEYITSTASAGRSFRASRRRFPSVSGGSSTGTPSC